MVLVTVGVFLLVECGGKGGGEVRVFVLVLVFIDIDCVMTLRCVAR